MRKILAGLTLIAACGAPAAGPLHPLGPRDVPALMRSAVQGLSFEEGPRPPEGSSFARTAYAEAIMDYVVRHGVNVGVAARGTVLALTFVEAGACDERLLMAAVDMMREPLRGPAFTAISCEPEGHIALLGGAVQ